MDSIFPQRVSVILESTKPGQVHPEQSAEGRGVEGCEMILIVSPGNSTCVGTLRQPRIFFTRGTLASLLSPRQRDQNLPIVELPLLAMRIISHPSTPRPSALCSG